MLQERAHPAFTFVYNYRNMQVTALWSYEQSAMYLHLYEPHVWFGKTFTSDALPDVTSPIYVSLGSTLGVHLLVTWVCNAWLYWFNLKRMMSCQLELESLLPLMQKKTPIYRWALRDTQTDYNVENMCVCVCGFHSVCASKEQILWQLCPDHPPSPESPAALSVLVCLHIPQCVWQLGQTTRLALLTVRR